MWVDDYELAMPPRRVSPLVTLQVLFGGALTQVAWFVLGFGLIFAWIFVEPTAWADLFAFGDVTSTEARIDGSEGTNAYINDVQIMKYTYTFKDGQGVERSGFSYSTDSPGSPAMVEYVPGHPETSRLEGMGRTSFGVLPSLVLIIPGLGLLMLYGGLRMGWRGHYLLRHGKLAYGTYQGKRPTNTTINDMPQYELTFTFTAEEDGQTYKALARNHRIEGLTDEKQERVLYDPTNPERAILWDNLPGEGYVDEMGNLVAEGWVGLKSLIVPTLCIGPHLGYMLFRLVS